jgi:CDP-paratose 2-epimerase
MSVVVVTGSGGLIGSEAALFYGKAGYDVVGIDNDMRSYFFGHESSTAWNRERVQRLLESRYRHYDLDIRDTEGVSEVFRRYGANIALIIHTAAQPSHDWAAREPLTDFTINANATLTLLETMRLYCSDATFIFTSTNKVYGDRPNTLPLMELETRWEVPPDHPYHKGIPEEMQVDLTMHSLFGASKLAADVVVQEYGRYFGFKTVCFRGGVLTGAQHSGSQLHGFLSYLMKCAITKTPYTIIGYKGKQVRDIIHASDVIRAFDAFFQHPQAGAVYNLGGGRSCNISVREAIALAEEITGNPMRIEYTDQHRAGDHIWYVTDLTKFQTDYPHWQLQYDTVRAIAEEIHEFGRTRWREGGATWSTMANTTY